MPDVLIEDAPPVVVAQPGAAVCQHIMYVSNSRASRNKEIRRRRGGRGRRQERRGHLEWTGGRGGTEMIKDSTEWTYSTIHLWQDWGCGGGCEELLSFHMSFRSIYSYTEKWNVWDKRAGNLLSCLLPVKRPMGGTMNACWVKSSWQLEFSECV